jgi:hypothetical protein
LSKVDQVFGGLPGPLIAEWGQAATFVAVTGSGTYDPATGDITPAETRTPVKVVITKIDPTEYGGLYQASDWKVYIDPAQIGGHTITTKDSFEVPTAGATVVAKVINPVTYRGDNPVLFACIARPQ